MDDTQKKTDIDTESRDKKSGSISKKPQENLFQRAYLNSITSFVDFIARSLTSFFVTPFLTRGLGAVLFGAWQVLQQFSKYVGWGDISATQVLKWAIARDRKILPENELRQYVTATFLVLTIVMPITLLAGVIIIWYAPVITGVDAVYADTVRIAAGLAVLSLMIAKMFDILAAVLKGMNLDFKRIGIFASLFMAAGGAKILVVIKGYGLIGLAAVQVVMAIITGGVLYWIVRANVPWFGLEKVGLKKAKTFIQTSGWYMLWTATSHLLNASDRMLLGFFAGPVLVTQYVITRYMAGTIEGLITNLLMGVKPGVSTLYGQGKYEKFLKFRSHIMLTTWILAGAVGTTVLALNQSFTLRWIREDHFAGQMVNLLVVIAIMQQLLISNDSSFITMTLDLKQKVLIGMMAAITSIGVSALLIGKLGIAGLCIGMITGRSIMSLTFPFIILKKTGHRVLKININARVAAVSGAMLAAGYYIGQMVLIDKWLPLIAMAAAIFTTSGLMIFTLGLSHTQRREILAYASKIKVFGKWTP